MIYFCRAIIRSQICQAANLLEEKFASIHGFIITSRYLSICSQIPLSTSKCSCMKELLISQLGLVIW